LSQHIGGYILCGTSRGYIYLGIVILRTREGTSLMDQFKWRVHPLGFSKRTWEGTSLVDLWLVKDFIRLKEISRIAGCLGTGCRHKLLPNQYKIIVFVFFFPTLFNFYCVLFFYALLLFKLHNLVVKPKLNLVTLRRLNF